MIPFNKPYLTGRESEYLLDVFQSGKLSGNGKYTKSCQQWFEKKFSFQKCLLTTSCTDALEMAALLIDIKPGDEIILPSYTFVSTANAFVLRGAKLKFVDSRKDHPGMDESLIEALITPKTKAIIPVHYAGIACNMDLIMELANKYNLYVIEDAAQAIDSFYIGKDGIRKALGSIGHLAAFSFHETKNIISGEGGMLVVNDPVFAKRAEIIWEKGTNRASFYRGEIDKYGWVDIGSSFLPSELTAAFLWAQINSLEEIQRRRLYIWEKYNNILNSTLGVKGIRKPVIPQYSTNNAHMYYVVCSDLDQRNRLIIQLKEKNINPVFHYSSLHRSSYFAEQHDGRELVESDRYSDCLVRLPFFCELTDEELNQIMNLINHFF